ncbi:MAG: hypothetical protein LUD00_11905 [Prevotellaceae bacterium]|nr:hypothetical protein [Prevotellaceae bacterium]
MCDLHILADVFDRLLIRDLYIFADVFDRLLRRYRATSPNLGEEPSYRIGCQCYTSAS